MNRIKEFIADAVYMGIEKYMSKHRFGFNSMIELCPMTHEKFKEHLYKVFQDNKQAVEDYLLTTPTTAPKLTYDALLEHYHFTLGLWCIDRNPNEVDIGWIRENAFQPSPIDSAP